MKGVGVKSKKRRMEKKKRKKTPKSVKRGPLI